MIEAFRDDILSTLTQGELDFLYFIELHLNNIASWSIEEAAAASYTSAAVIERACRKLRLSGYAELRFLVSNELRERSVSVQEDVSDYSARTAQDALLRETKLTFQES